MEPFLISEKRLADLTATRQGRVSLAGFNFQAAYAVARLASMLTRRPVLDLPDFPLRLRYDWGEDLDELCENGRVVFTQCKRIANIGQPAGLSSVLQSFAAKWLSVPAAQRANVQFRLVCTDTRFRPGGQLTSVAADSSADTQKHFETALSTKPGDKSDRALWQADADAIGHAQLFAALWERTDVAFLPPDAINGLPASPILHAEREALEDLLTFSHIHPSRQAEALSLLRRIIHDNLIVFAPANETEVNSPREAPRTRARADVANALASCQLAAGGSLPFEVVDRTFLSIQRQAPRRQFVARQPDWADVVRGSDDTVKFIERTITSEALGKVVTELVEPIERGTAHRLHMLFITGAPGSGKTTLVRRVAAMLVDEGRIVVADAGVDAHEPAGSPEDYATPLEQLANGGRPVVFLLDDPLFGDSPWIPVLKRLNRPGLKVAVLAPCPQILFDQHRGSVPFGVVKDFKIGPPTETERTEMRRLYGRKTDALMTADEFLVITMEAAADLPFDEIMRRLWQTLNDGQPPPGDWNAAAWTLRAFMVVAYFHRAYAGCPEPILRAVLAASLGGQPTGDVSTELARLKSRDGWLTFKFGDHERVNWAYQGTPISTAHQRIALRAWELRPLDWVDVGSKIVEASLLVPQSIRQLGALAARLLSSDTEADRQFAKRLIDAWSQPEHQAKFETRELTMLVAALQTGGQRQAALQFKTALMARAQSSNDGWVAALQLCYLSGDTQATQSYSKDLDLPEVISHADFSLAPSRATQFFSRLPSGVKPTFAKRILGAFDGSLAWEASPTLIVWLLRYGAPEEMLQRTTKIEAWLKAHSDDTNVRNGYLGLLSKQGLDKEQLDRVITDTESWLKAHPDDTHVRNGYLGLLSKQGLDKEQLDRVITDTESWLKAHPDDTNVRNGYLGFLDSKPACFKLLQATMRKVEDWLGDHLQDNYTRQRFETLKIKGAMQLPKRVVADVQQTVNHAPKAPQVFAEKKAHMPAAQTLSAPKPKANSLYIWKEHEGRFKEGIERVLSRAWSTVPADTPPEDRFEAAYQSALKIISGLSRHIKHQVSAHFNQENWESLRARAPNP